METNTIPEGVLRLTLANASQYVVLALFYIIATKTNALSQTEIGTLSILNFLSSTFSLLTVIALPAALVKFTSEKSGNKIEATAIRKVILRTVITLSIIGITVSIILSQLISQYFWNSSEFVMILIINFTYALLSNIITLYTSTLQALYLFGKMSTITITYVVSSRIIAITLALLKMGVIGVIIGYVIGAIIAITVAMFFLHSQLPKTSKTTPLRPLLAFSFPLFLGQVIGIILNWADIVIITSLTRDLSQTGIYGIVVNSIGALTIMYVPISATIFPALSAQIGQQKPKNVSNIIKMTSRYIIYIIFPSCIGLAIIAPTALTFFYGPVYANGALPLAILAITTIVTALVSLFTITFMAIGKTKQNLKIGTVAAFSLILGLILFVSFLQTTGAALARLTTEIIIFTIAYYLLKKELEISLDREAFWKSILATIATIPFLLTLELRIGVELNTTERLIIEIIVASGIYLFCIYMLKALKKQDFELLKHALPKPLIKYVTIIERIMVR